MEDETSSQSSQNSSTRSLEWDFLTEFNDESDLDESLVTKHTLALAIKLKLILKGFIQEELFATRAKPGKKKTK
ncbi:hypothetical protein BpHYR1_010131 [Brachionus plicatilis]|uniref:Uncharacterized protein n=1 Tax=Brachionus plicatilis TaxID=10195 RepID=A0A3M7R9B2_BRAPC|nr:hypothetical protein BpHYR1_010131 [Brachionus plicatilis]